MGSLLFFVIVAEHPSVSPVIYVSKSSVVNSRQGLSESAADFGFLIPKYISFFDEFFQMPFETASALLSSLIFGID